MLRSDLIKVLADKNPDLTSDEVARIVDVFFDEIAQRLAESGRVEIRGFGMFSTVERPARPSRDPRNGDAIWVPSKRVPRFKPSKAIIQRLNSD